MKGDAIRVHAFKMFKPMTPWPHITDLKKLITGEFTLKLS